MKQYKLSVTKGQNKYTILLSGETQEEVKEKAHKEGYSIISYEEISDLKIVGSSFLFQVLDEKTKEVKSGTIFGSDIFKVYVKLRKDLGYTVLSLFLESDKLSPQSQKDETLKSLQGQFEIFEQRKENHTIVQEEKIDFKNSETNISDFYLKKELDETYKLIEYVLKKLQSLIDGTEGIQVSQETKDKLKEIYNGIIKIKKTTNISKLKQIGETALLKIGQIELENLESSQADGSRTLLKETNSLLKQIGSKQVFIEESRDIKKIISKYIESWKTGFEQLKDLKNVFRSRKTEIDTNSYSYLKTLLLLEKYKQRNRQNLREILSNILVFVLPFGERKEKKDLLLLKRKVIEQNISLLNAKRSGKVFSYTIIKKGYDGIVGALLYYLSKLKESCFMVILFYSFFFLGYLGIQNYLSLPSINFGALFYILLIIITTTLLSVSKTLFSISFNFVFLLFVFIFGVVNF